MARKQGVICSYILMVAEMFSSIFFTPFLIRSFGQAEYGIYSLVASITSYLFLLDMGIGNALVRYMAKFRFLGQKDKQRELLSVTVLFYLFVGILVIIIGMILKNNMNTIFNTGLSSEELIRAKTMFSITMLNVAVTLVLAPFNKIIIAYEKFVFSKMLATLMIVVRISISIVVLLMGGKGISIVTVNFCITVLSGILSVLYVTIKLKILPVLKKLDFTFIKEVLSYSLFVFIQMIATQINAMTDHILIGAMVQASAVILGIYAVGAQINAYFQTLATSINSVLMPGVVGMVENNSTPEMLLKEMIKIGRILFIFLGIIWGVFLVAGKSFIILWAGEENSQAYIVACILITPMMIALIQSIGAQILWAKNKHQMQAYLKIIVAVLNIVLSILLIRWNPLIGASLGTAIAIIFGDIIVMNIVFAKYIEISMKSYYSGLLKGIMPSLLITIISGIFFKNIIHIPGWIGFLVYCSIMVLIYSILMYFKGLNTYEKNLFSGFLKALKRKVRK